MLKIIKEDQPLKAKPIIAIIYGTPDTGKTSFSFTAENPLLFDCDNGIHRCVNRKTFTEADNYNDILSFVQSNQITDMGFKTLVIDTGGSLIDQFMTVEALKTPAFNYNGALSLKGFGQIKSMFNTFVNVLQQKNIDIVFICHEKEREDKIRPDLTGSSYDMLMAKADLVGRMTFNEQGQRKISFNSTAQIVGKNCANIEEMLIPHYTSTEYSNSFAKIIEKVKEKMLSVNEETEKALEIIKKLKTRIAKIKDLDIKKFDKIENETTDLSTVYQLAIKKELSERYATLFEDSALKDVELDKLDTEEEKAKYLDSVITMANEQDQKHQRACKIMTIKLADKLDMVFDKEKSQFIAK